MARSRNIKPGFFKNDALAELPPLARLLFIGLWTIADRDGRLKDRPKWIKAECLPYDDGADVDQFLDHLRRDGFIVRYEVDQVKYIQVVNWHKHQQPHVKEKASEIPEFKGGCKKPVKSTMQDTGETEACMEEAALIPDSLNLIPDSLEHTDRTRFDQHVGFEEAWKIYPRREGKKQAWHHYRATVKTEEDHARCLTSIGNYKQLVECENANRRGDPRPWMHGKTFFNNWQDYEEIDLDSCVSARNFNSANGGLVV